MFLASVWHRAPGAVRFRRLRHAMVASVWMLAGMPSGWAQAEPFIGQLMLFGGNFCPQGWAHAQGQLLPIAQNVALYSLLGTTYGGNGQTTFALPDLRGRAPVGVGQGPGLGNVTPGQMAGAESTALTLSQLPPHSHAYTLEASNAPATHATPASGRVLAQAQNAGVYGEGAANVVLDSGQVGVTGQGSPVSIRDPYLGMTWCIALDGVFPPRN